MAFILGLAFAAVATAFVDVLLGAISYVAGGEVSFDRLAIEKDGNPVIPYGPFLTALISFLIIAFVLFLIVKAYNRTRPPTPVTNKACPFLRERYQHRGDEVPELHERASCRHVARRKRAIHSAGYQGGAVPVA